MKDCKYICESTTLDKSKICKKCKKPILYDFGYIARLIEKTIIYMLDYNERNTKCTCSVDHSMSNCEKCSCFDCVICEECNNIIITNTVAAAITKTSSTTAQDIKNVMTEVMKLVSTNTQIPIINCNKELQNFKTYFIKLMANKIKKLKADDVRKITDICGTIAKLSSGHMLSSNIGNTNGEQKNTQKQEYKISGISIKSDEFTEEIFNIRLILMYCYEQMWEDIIEKIKQDKSLDFKCSDGNENDLDKIF